MNEDELAHTFDDLLDLHLREAENQPADLSDIDNETAREFWKPILERCGALNIEEALAPCPSGKPADVALWKIRQLKGYGMPRAELEELLWTFCDIYGVEPELAFDFTFTERFGVNG